jgi:hypothetical protein
MAAAAVVDETAKFNNQRSADRQVMTETMSNDLVSI